MKLSAVFLFNLHKTSYIHFSVITSSSGLNHELHLALFRGRAFTKLNTRTLFEIKQHAGDILREKTDRQIEQAQTGSKSHYDSQ